MIKIGEADNLAGFQGAYKLSSVQSSFKEDRQMDSHLRLVLAYKIDDTKIYDRSTRMYGSESE